MRVFLAGVVVLAFWPVACAQNSDFRVDRLVVYKQERKLVLLSQGKEVRSYRVALGGEPIGPKSRQGDHRTPEGVYVLDSRNPSSHFYKAFHISYPNVQDIAAAKKLGVSPGGDIMLHGLPKEYAWVGKAHALHDWTDGCVAVTDEEIDEIWKLVRVGTPIEIKP
ncbi:MAG TPA: L,D-transpeptidase family protein [Terriglobales bacterium]|jgi:murein L,D-transpeptidase YafK|nr:L,D-transpeptidase family protein [Terriglobales bacterium]